MRATPFIIHHLSLPSDPSLTHEIDSLLEKSSTYEDAQPRQMLSLARRAVALAREAEYDAGVAYGLRAMGRAHMVLGNAKEAQQHLIEALDAFESLREKEGAPETTYAQQVAGLHGYLGVLHQSRGEYGQALRHLGTALRLFKDIGNESAIASSYLNIGNIHFMMEHYDLAAQQYRKAHEIYEREGKEAGVGICLVNLGDVNIRRKEFERALHYSQQALEIFQRLEQPRNIALTHCAIAAAYRAIHNYSNARLELAHAFDIADQNGYLPVRGRALLEQGRILKEESDIENAVKTFENAYRLGKELENRYIEVDALKELQPLALLRGEMEAAARYKGALERLLHIKPLH